MKLSTDMRNENYKGEKYLDTSEELFIKLNEICEVLLDSFRNDKKSYPVAEIIKMKNYYQFNELWEHLPNIPDKKNSKNEYKGLYAFAHVENGDIDIMYIGISQRTRARFSDHTKKKKSKDASWAYLMIKHEISNLTTRELREVKIPDYQKEYIHPLHFTFYPIEDNMLLQMAEVYCVNKLKAKWNSFETH